MVLSLLVVSAATFASAATSTATCVSLTKNLSKGQENSEVLSLQQFLFDGGYLKQKPSGLFTPLTSSGVKSFQLANGISPVGTVGPKTRVKVKEVSCRKIAIQNTSSTTPALVQQDNVKSSKGEIGSSSFPKILNEFGITQYEINSTGSPESINGKQTLTQKISFTFNNIKKSTTTTFVYSSQETQKDSDDVLLVVEGSNKDVPLKVMSYSCSTKHPGTLTNMIVMGTPSRMDDSFMKRKDAYDWLTSGVLYLWQDEVDGLPHKNLGTAVSNHSWRHLVKYAYCVATYRDGTILMSKLIPVTIE